MPDSPPTPILLIILSALVSVALTRVALWYGLRQGLLDAPGQRRLHAVPTPRGGGIGIVVAVLLFGLAPRSGIDAVQVGGLMLAVVMVALVGWVDDHRSLSARFRFGTHLVAGALAALVVTRAEEVEVWRAGRVLALGALVLAIAWSINLHNFMDGINGLLGSQVVFVLTTLAVAGAYGSHEALLLLGCATAAATAAFLPFNFPRARIFLGDVGSGALGLLLAIAVGLAVQAHALSLAAALVLCSSFLVDATCTLLSRALRGRRWYSAHREHLYQWLVRSGLSHPTVVGLYLGWNLLVALPAMAWVESIAGREAAAGNPHSLYSWAAAGVVLALGVAVWWRSKQQCLRRVRLGIGT